MSLLRNQTDALALAAQLDKAALEKRLGTLPAVEGSIVGALYNADTEGKMNMLLYSNPAGIVAGMAAAVKLSGAQGAILVTDQEINVQEYMAAAATAGVVLTIEQAAMVNKTAHKKDLMMTFEALAALAEKMTGRTPGIFAAVDDRVPEEVSPDISVGALIGSDENYKGIVAGHRFYTAEEVKNMPLGRLETWGGWIRTVKQSDCAVDIARQEVHALRQKSCGKCTFCREGLYQIPTICFDAEQYGTYKVKIQVMSATSDTAKYYLDGIRIYNPVDPEGKDAEESESAYQLAGEAGPVVTEIREILLGAGALTDESGQANGMVYLDNLEPGEDGTSEISDYEKDAPKHEVYLSEGNAIAFTLKDYTDAQQVYLAAKAPEGTAATLRVTDGTRTKDVTIDSTSEQYFEITPTSRGHVVIENVSAGDTAGLISITKIRTTKMQQSKILTEPEKM